MLAAQKLTWRRRIVDRVIQTLRRLANENSSPAKLGSALGLGILIGTTPLIGAHLALCIVAATLLRLNRMATYLGATIASPFLAPFLIYGSLQLGTFTLTGRWLPMTFGELSEVDPWELGESWMLGSIIVGALTGLLGGIVTWLGISLYRAKHPAPLEPDDGSINETSNPVSYDQPESP